MTYLTTFSVAYTRLKDRRMIYRSINNELDNILKKAAEAPLKILY
jgi:hypothetical protein